MYNHKHIIRGIKGQKSVPPGFYNSAPAEFFAESGKLHRICKYAQNLAENDVFGLPKT